MYRVVDARGTGKTFKLLEKANEVGGIIVCKNARGMREKAKTWGFDNIQDFVDYYPSVGYHYEQPIFIDELEEYAKVLAGRTFAGYTYTFFEEDESI